MTALELITNLSKTSLVGHKISDLTDADNKATLLVLLNMAKNKIAEDTLLWLDGEQITMVDGTTLYTLTTTPIQIIDAYDDSNILRPRNNPDYFGYYQTSPNQLRFNNIQDGTVVNVNYYKTPDDYLIDDEIVIPATLLSALQFYVVHKAFEIYKADSDVLVSEKYYGKYLTAVNDYTKNSDSVDVDTVVSMVNKIWKRGIR